ncbi:hypothetical protein SPBR_06801 [Sporothrix brasiliensis 5110]|uniref:Zn(2)-C6 fungal-type domain-containing protein n=1 Tax=Sporothrix brasiliensis 5110 TaxID=1398154 RepID=A0A0C2FBF1_9PEZI|nr:uncharacterized protein SPBR_06801 [Sporothrix brasiliensis 5110]KIH88423.1 hypothetical protein SPBR_06801 [Sporothrix brasiliensis 5110]
MASEMDSDTVLATNMAPSLYFCPVCGKPSTQESSFTRHVQYCRRRAATKRTTRPRACRHCRATKSKCDAQWPCSRCTSKHKECVYDKPWHVADAASDSTAAKAPKPARAAECDAQQTSSGAGAGALVTSASSSSSDTAAGSNSNSPAASDDMTLHRPSGRPSSGQEEGKDGQSTTEVTVAMSTAVSAALPVTLSVAEAATGRLTSPSLGTGNGNMPSFLLPQAMNMFGLNGFGSFGTDGVASPSLGFPMVPPSSVSGVNMPSPLSLHLPYAAPPNPILEVSERSSPSPISADLRRLIVSMVRTFPHMMTRPGNMPPFIHRVGCGLHYDSVEVEKPFSSEVTDGMSSSSSSSSALLSSSVYGRSGVLDAPDGSVSTSSPQMALFTPLPIMAACVGISHAFVTRSAHSDEFLWRSIDKEHQNIVNRLRSLSFGEIFVSIQALAIYTTMRLIVYGREYFCSDMSLLDTMGKLSDRFHELWHGPFTPAHYEDSDLIRTERPKWENWIFDETRRRIVTICWLMSLAVNSRSHTYKLSQPEKFPLPSSRRLWEADSQSAWEREYDNHRFEKHILFQSAMHSNPISNGPRFKLTTVGDLSRAIDRAVADEGSFGLPSNKALYEDDLLAYWHAGVDSLGMMVTAAAAEHAFEP